MKHLTGVGVAIDTVTSVGVSDQSANRKRKNQKRQVKRGEKSLAVEPLFSYDV